MTSRTLEGVAGKNWIYIIYVVQNWKPGEASGQSWVKSAELRLIAGQKWQAELWVCEMRLQSWMGAWGCRGDGGLQDRTMEIFLVYRLFSQHTSSRVPNLARTTKVCTPHLVVVFQTKVWMGSMSPNTLSAQGSPFVLLKAEWWEAKEECVGRLEWWRELPAH